MKRIIATIGAAILGFLIPANAQNNVTLYIGSPANSTPPYYGLWTDTGISVTSGEWIDVNAAGLWTWAVNSSNSPDGTNLLFSFNLFLGNGIHGSMVAYIGSDPFQGNWGNGAFFPQSTGYWELGTSGQFMSPASGELWLGLNEDAVGQNTGDNLGGATATVFTNFTANPSTAGPALAINQVTSNQFTLSVSGGVPSTTAAIFDSADLTHWTLIDAVALDGTGSHNYYVNNTGVPYRFYKVCNGQFISATIGFVRLLAPASGSSSATIFIANQLDSPRGNTLDGLFNPMADGTVLPAGTVLMKWNGSVFVNYIWNGSSWSGNTTLNPGEGAVLTYSSANSFAVTFEGTVREGTSSLSVSAGTSLISSILPKAGYVQTTLGYAPSNGTTINTWNGSGYNQYTYSTKGGWNPSQPIPKVGEGFLITTSSANVWQQNYSSHQF